MKYNLAQNLRRFRSPALFLIAYWLLRGLFSYTAENHGLLAPSGSLNSGMAAFGLVVLALRLLAIFVLPAIVAYRILDLVANRFG